MSIKLQDFFNLNVDGSTFFHSANLSEIVKQYRTPFYLYNMDIFDAIIKKYKNELDDDVSIRFAAKSNSNIDVLRRCARHQIGVDVVSDGELRRAIRAGVDPAKIDYAGVGKTPYEIERAIELGVGLVCIESEYELELISSIISEEKYHKSPTRYLIRVNPNTSAETHPYLTTGKFENKFGIPIDKARNNLRKWNNLLQGKLVGLQIHIGSQINDVLLIEKAAIEAINLARENTDVDLNVLNIGGGLGVNYDLSEVQSFSNYCRMVNRVNNEFSGLVIIEPGRSISALIGLLVGTCLHHKMGSKKNFLISDIAMNDLIRPSLYESVHRIRFLRKEEERQLLESSTDVVGPICESGDFIARNLHLPFINIGENLIVECAGAYGYVMSSVYNLRSLPAEIVVDGKNHWISTPAISFEEG